MQAALSNPFVSAFRVLLVMACMIFAVLAASTANVVLADHTEKCNRFYDPDADEVTRLENEQKKSNCLSVEEAKLHQFIHNNPDLFSAQNVVDVFANSWNSWSLRVFGIAKALFYSLIIFETVLCFGMLALRNGSLEEFTYELVIRVIILGFGLFILNNHTILFEILSGFHGAANIVTGRVFNQSTPIGQIGDVKELLELPIEVVKNFIDAAKGLSFVTDAPVILMLIAAGIIVLWALSIAGIQLVLVICEAYIILVVGLLSLGFYSLKITREYPMRFFGSLIGIGFKLFALNIIIAIGLRMAQEWARMPVVHDPLVYMGLAAAALMFKEIAVRIPDYIQGLLSGSPGSGLSATAPVTGAMAVGGAYALGFTTIANKLAAGFMAGRDAYSAATAQGAQGFGGMAKAMGSALGSGLAGAVGEGVRGSSPTAKSMNSTKHQILEAVARDNYGKQVGADMSDAKSFTGTPSPEQ